MSVPAYSITANIICLEHTALLSKEKTNFLTLILLFYSMLIQCSTCSKRPLTPNPRIPHEQVSSASECIKTPHHHSHTETERQHTPNQVCGSADTIFWRHYHNMLHNTLHHHKTQCQPYYRNHTL